MKKNKFNIGETVYTVDSGTWKIVKFKIGAIKEHSSGTLMYAKHSEYEKFYGEDILAKNKKDLLIAAKKEMERYQGNINKNWKKITTEIKGMKK